MKINQVEELVGITKKNIRFYEEQGLIHPSRNQQNGYREYSLEDVECLNKIKLLRKLEIPIEQIRLMQEKSLSFDKCMEDHMIRLSHRQHDLEVVKTICTHLSEKIDDLSELKSEQYFEEIKKLEEGGMRFMNIEHTDIAKKKRGPVLAASIVIAFMVVLIVLTIWLKTLDPQTPIAVIAILTLILGAVIVGTALALRQRLHEIEGGELDEARKY